MTAVKRAWTRPATVAAIAVIGALLALSVSMAGCGSSGDSATPVPDQTKLLAEGRAIAALEAAVKKDAAAYEKTVAAIKKKAARNKLAVAAWDKEWKKLQADYQDEKAAVQSYNASQPSTSSETTTRTVKIWDPFSQSYISHTETYTIPGHSAQLKSLPAYPSKPAKLKVLLKKERRRLARLAGALDKLAAQTAQTQAGPPLAAAAVALKDAVTLLRQRVEDARSALQDAVKSKGSKGEVIDQKQIADITVDGVAEAVQAVRAALLEVMQSEGLEPSAL